MCRLCILRPATFCFYMQILATLLPHRLVLPAFSRQISVLPCRREQRTRRTPGAAARFISLPLRWRSTYTYSLPSPALRFLYLLLPGDHLCPLLYLVKDRRIARRNLPAGRRPFCLSDGGTPAADGLCASYSCALAVCAVVGQLRCYTAGSAPVPRDCATLRFAR